MVLGEVEMGFDCTGAERGVGGTLTGLLAKAPLVGLADRIRRSPWKTTKRKSYPKHSCQAVRGCRGTLKTIRSETLRKRKNDLLLFIFAFMSTSSLWNLKLCL